MLSKETLGQFNKELSAGVKALIAKYENVAKGVVIKSVVTEREPSQDGHSFEYVIRILAQASKEVDEETSP